MSLVTESLTQRLLYRSDAAKKQGAPQDFPRLPEIPAGRYRDPHFLALERESLWSSAWLYAAHLDELPDPGSYKLWESSGVPVLILRDRDGRVRAFYNACRHRGGPLVCEPAGRIGGRLVCRYHGWTYELDGKLTGVRDRRDFPGLELADRSLIPLRCELLGNWIFVNRDPDAPELTRHLGPVHDYFGKFSLETLRLVHREIFTVRCNFKMLLEGFLEVYHLKAVHAGTVDRFLDYRGTHMELWKNGHSFMVTANRSPDWKDPGARGMAEIPGADDLERHYNPSFNVFPNLVTPVSPTGLPFNLVWPVSDGEAMLEVVWFAPDWGGGPRPAGWERRLENYSRILREDIVLMEQIQTSVHSPGFKGMPLGYPERRIYHWHEELDRRIGAARIPEALRVEPVLGPWVTEGWA
jgi:phenylpropionate dioxygenase-like ring-hydroxylating dioxygenase large terminal subunit